MQIEKTNGRELMCLSSCALCESERHSVFTVWLSGHLINAPSFNNRAPAKTPSLK